MWSVFIDRVVDFLAIIPATQALALLVASNISSVSLQAPEAVLLSSFRLRKLRFRKSQFTSCHKADT